MVPLFMSFQSIRLLPLCFPWLSSLSQVLFRLQQSAKIIPYVCVFYHAHYKYLWVWVYHLLPAHVPISLSEWWGSCVQMLQCAHNNVTRKQEVTVRMNWKLKKKKILKEIRSVWPGRATVYPCFLQQIARRSVLIKELLIPEISQDWSCIQGVRTCNSWQALQKRRREADWWEF